LKNNKIAKEFWFKTLKKNGYKEIYLSDVGAGDEYCDQYGFTKI